VDVKSPLPLPFPGSSPLPSDEASDHEAAFDVLMKMLTLVPCVVDVGDEMLPSGCGRMSTVTLADDDCPLHAVFAAALKVVAWVTGTTALPDDGRFAPTPSTDTSAVGSDEVQDNLTDSLAQTALDDDVIVTTGALHGCFTARGRAFADGTAVRRTSAAANPNRFTMALPSIEECQLVSFRYPLKRSPVPSS
jgi:hypothetical protein